MWRSTYLPKVSTSIFLQRPSTITRWWPPLMGFWKSSSANSAFFARTTSIFNRSHAFTSESITWSSFWNSRRDLTGGFGGMSCGYFPSWFSFCVNKFEKDHENVVKQFYSIFVSIVKFTLTITHTRGYRSIPQRWVRKWNYLHQMNPYEMKLATTTLMMMKCYAINFSKSALDKFNRKARWIYGNHWDKNLSVNENDDGNLASESVMSFSPLSWWVPPIPHSRLEKNIHSGINEWYCFQSTP